MLNLVKVKCLNNPFSFLSSMLFQGGVSKLYFLFNMPQHVNRLFHVLDIVNGDYNIQYAYYIRCISSLSIRLMQSIIVMEQTCVVCVTDNISWIMTSVHN